MQKISLKIIKNNMQKISLKIKKIIFKKNSTKNNRQIEYYLK